MSTEGNKACSRRVFEEVWNQGKLDEIYEIFDTDFILHDPGAGEVRGPEGYKEFVTMYRTAFPDIHFTIEDQIAEKDKVVNLLTFTATHKGRLKGIPPTGAQVTVTGVTFCCYGDGKMLEAWVHSDALGMLQQLGVMPPMGRGGK